MKTCFKCGIAKPLTDFYKHPRMADGRLNKCKQCAKRDVAQHREENIDRIRAYDRERGMAAHRVSAREAYEATPEGKAAMARARATYKAKSGDRIAARNAVMNAIRDNRIEPWPACAEPDCECATVEAHHPDYSRPLDVVWLCSKHHKQLHREHRAYLRQQQGKEAA